MTLLIGDVHGKFGQYKTLTKDHRNTIQVGDLGVGFRRLGSEPGDPMEYLTNPPYDYMFAGNHRFIRGNHDNPAVCSRHTQCIKDGTIEDGVLYIGGAWSIDQAYRTEGYSWWPDEQCSLERLNEIVDLAILYKPHTIISHDCPEGIVPALFLNHSKEHIHTRTGQALESIRQLAPPKQWIFGHWHESRATVITGTMFICLAELETIEIDLCL